MRVTIFVGEKSVSIGGMQTHFNNVAGYFLKNHQLDYIIYRFPFMEVYSGEQQKEVPIKSLEAFWDAIKESAVFFFSDGWWIEEWGDLSPYGDLHQSPGQPGQPEVNEAAECWSICAKRPNVKTR